MEEHPYISLGPSAIGRWGTCTASPGYIARNKHLLPEQESFAASEGTFAHEKLEEMVNTMLDFSVTAKEALDISIGADVEGAEFSLGDDFTMQSKLLPAAEFLVSLKSEDDTLQTEVRLPIFYKDDQKGFVDYVYHSPNKLKIWDLKYGRMPVPARSNKQLATYAVSAYEAWGDLYGWDDSLLCDLGIYQPADYEPRKLWCVTIKELKIFLAETEATARAIVANPAGGELVPSKDACMWCEMKELCVANGGKHATSLPTTHPILEVAEAETLPPAEMARLAVDSLPDKTVLTLEQIGAVLSVRNDIKKWVEDIATFALALVEQGTQIPGHKLVAGRGRRQWTDEAAAEKLLRNKLPKAECFEQKLLSVPKAEKVLKGMELSTRFTNQFETLVTKSEGRPVLAPEDDKRAAIEQEVPFVDIEEEASLGELL
jgi:hypothetical protein